MARGSYTGTALCHPLIHRNKRCTLRSSGDPRFHSIGQKARKVGPPGPPGGIIQDFSLVCPFPNTISRDDEGDCCRYLRFHEAWGPTLEGRCPRAEHRWETSAVEGHPVYSGIEEPSYWIGHLSKNSYYQSMRSPPTGAIQVRITLLSTNSRRWLLRRLRVYRWNDFTASLLLGKDMKEMDKD
ncbi:hypothetical protein FA13DRAFT_1716422 [Coprinellus micaceus]|uniref:Uncharacterized protein n=1 Tax=Coprinellus micaceus TaxID=71717 RepID=A0A4Y7SK55_COPMI|nr:hypothetical protein FA13DRAFT_1716422 [Coprinellus micaceus]